ncbi:nuclear transport factor 2 family protein [Streptomyces sp. A5-4]|uniref:nuclear transport factor 2 family protein n=1 Tax=Streptomyces sp. A5-4 TaxID=3384771 RepID=UPI003DA7C645
MSEITASVSARATVDRFLSRLAVQDADGIADVFAEHIDWFVPGADHLPWTGPRTRREDVPAYFRTMWTHFVEGESEAVIDHVLVDGPDVAVFGSFSHTVKSSERRFSTPVALHLTVHEGQITRLRLFEDTFAAAQAMPPTDS